MSHTPQNVTASSIRWLPIAAQTVELRCTVCGEPGPKPALLEIASMADGSHLTLFSCPACASKFYDPPDICDFSEIQGNDTYFWKSYVEVLCGIWEMFWPAAVALRKPDASLLDVGCGFGFTSDAWRRLHGEAVGVELAEYGRVGAEQLGLPIYSDYLQNIAVLQDRRFDVVYASEVIEHVPDSHEFATLLSRYVAEEGVLCLTTPNAEYIKQQHAGPSLVAALSPGFHAFLISPAQMKRILSDCGFEHVVVREFGERLIAWASRQAVNIGENSLAVRAEYLRYLEEMLVSRQQNDVVTDGIAYRHFRDSLMAQNLDAARKSLARLETSLDEKYSAAWRDPVRTTDRVLAIATPEQYDAAFPWFLPNLYYLRGLYAKLSERDEQSARRHFRACRDITIHIAGSWGISYVIEVVSFLPEARQQEAISAALAGDPSVCEEWLAAMVDGGYQNSPEISGGRLSNRQIEQAYLEGLSILSTLNRPAALAAALRNCLQYLDETYENWIPSDTGAQVQAPGAELLHEQQMYLHYKIAVACIQLGTRPELVGPLLQLVLKLGAMMDPPSIMSNWIAAEAKSKLAAFSPRPNPIGGAGALPKQAVSYSFNLAPKKKP